MTCWREGDGRHVEEKKNKMMLWDFKRVKTVILKSFSTFQEFFNIFVKQTIPDIYAEWFWERGGEVSSHSIDISTDSM